MSHASEGLVTAALLSSTEELRAAGMEHEGELDAQHPAVLGLACSPSDGAYAYASLDGGTRVVRRRSASGDAISAEIEEEISGEIEGEMEEVSEAQLGSGNARANVLHLPPETGAPCAEIEAHPSPKPSHNLTLTQPYPDPNPSPSPSPNPDQARPARRSMRCCTT